MKIIDYNIGYSSRWCLSRGIHADPLGLATGVSGYADPFSRALGQTDYGPKMKAVGRDGTGFRQPKVTLPFALRHYSDVATSFLHVTAV